MQKVIDLLEKHVQWLALGLGVVWLLFMTWSYVIKPPAAVTIGSTELKAGDVDQYTVEKAVKPLQVAMQPKEAPPMPVDNFAERWLARMDWQGVQPLTLAGMIASPPPLPDEQFKRGPTAPMIGPDGKPINPQNQVQVAANNKANGVPVLKNGPAVSDWRFGRSTAMVSPPVPAVPAGAPVPQPLPPVETDKDWITQSFKVALADINAAFDAPNAAIPPGPIHMTAFLKVEMERQELMSGNTWGNNTIVPLVNTGVVRQPYPDAKASVFVQNAYLNWAVAQTGDIVQPVFYQTVQNKGDMWQRPGEAPAAAPGAFDPSRYLTGPIPADVTPEQRKMIMDARQKAAKAREAAKVRKAPARTPRAPGPGGPGGPGMEGDPQSYAPVDSERPKFLQVRQYPPRQPFNPGLPPDASMEDPSMMEGDMGVAPPPQLLGVGVPDVDYPNGPFDPALWTAAAVPPTVRPSEITIWGHDETIQPGKTYRYRARYYIKNPLFQQPGAVKKPADARQFDIVSPFSDWGPAIEVPALTNFFIANVAPNANRVRFDVYTWEKGVNHHTTVTAAPGDAIAGNNGGVNFNTGNTVVDLRADLKTNNPVVILANATGEPVIRTQKGDSTNPINLNLKKLVAAQQQQAAAATPGAPGVVPTVR